MKMKSKRKPGKSAHVAVDMNLAAVGAARLCGYQNCRPQVSVMHAGHQSFCDVQFAPLPFPAYPSCGGQMRGEERSRLDQSNAG